MAEPFIGEIKMFSGNFAPRGWAFCDGQLLAINSNTALYSILGTIYGGDGRTTFALPDLRGRMAIHAGSGPGLSLRRLGEKSGQETVTLNILEIPFHNHSQTVSTDSGDTAVPTGNLLANTGGRDPDYKTPAGANTAQNSTGNVGGNQSHNNMPPYQVVNYIIALQGIFPSRD